MRKMNSIEDMYTEGEKRKRGVKRRREKERST